jgi:phenylpyruvate tautomerase PptA (4-oxalocrotonate tautomerase family)
MPCLEISMPRVDTKTKAQLASKLTEAFATASGFPAEIFGIRFNEYERGTAASGGTLYNDGNSVPYLHFLLYSPRLKRSVKQKLVEILSTVFAECVGHADWLPIIHLSEHPYDNVGVAGKLLSDSYEECAKSHFYYELPDE